MTLTDAALRICTKCGKSFPATTEYFWAAITVVKGKKYEGLRGDCINCTRQIRKRHYRENEHVRAALAQSGKRRRQREDVLKYERNSSRERKSRERSTEEGAAKQREHLRAWRKSNPEKYGHNTPHTMRL